MIKLTNLIRNTTIGLTLLAASTANASTNYFDSIGLKWINTDIPYRISTQKKPKPQFFFQRLEKDKTPTDNYSLEYIVGKHIGLGEIVQNECGFSRFEEVVSLNNLKKPYNLSDGQKLKLPKNCKSPFSNYKLKAVKKFNSNSSQNKKQTTPIKTQTKTNPQILPIHYLKPKTYTVKKLDTLSGIAKKFTNLNWHQLYLKNKEIIGKNPNDIKIGEKLQIPNQVKNKNIKKTRIQLGSQNLSYLEKTLGFLNSQENYKGEFTANTNQNYQIISQLSGTQFKSLEKILSGPSGNNKLWAARRIASLSGIIQGASANREEAKNNIISNTQNIENVANKYRPNDSKFKELVASISIQECGARDRCISKANSYGANGLSIWTFGGGKQSNGEIWDPINPFNVAESFDRSAQNLDLLLNKYRFKTTLKSNQSLAILAYHQGESKVDLALNMLSANGEKPTYKNVLDLQISFEKKTVEQLEQERQIALKNGNNSKIKLATKNLRLGQRNLQKGNRYTNIPYFRGIDSSNELAESKKFISNEGQRYVKRISSIRSRTKKMLS